MTKISMNLDCVRTGVKLPSNQIYKIFSERGGKFQTDQRLEFLKNNSYYILNENLSCTGAVYVTDVKRDVHDHSKFNYTCKPIMNYLDPRDTVVVNEIAKSILYTFDMDSPKSSVDLSFGEVKAAHAFFVEDKVCSTELSKENEYYPLYLGKFSENDKYMFVKRDDSIKVYNKIFEDVTEDFDHIKDFCKALSIKNFIFSGIDCKEYISIDDLYFYDSSLLLKPYQERVKLLKEFKYNNYFKKYQTFIVLNQDQKDDVVGLLSELESTNGIRYLNKDNTLMEFAENTERNEEFFDTWNKDMAYFLGFLITDGHIDTKEDRIEFRISATDKSILQKLASKLGKDGLVEKDGYVKYRFGSKYMINQLKKLNATGLKEKRTTYTKVPEEYKWSFAKGVFDADGSVAENRIQIDSSNKGLLKWLKDMFSKVADTKLYNYDSYDKLVVLGDEGTKVLQKLNSSGVGLKRKTKLQQ